MKGLPLGEQASGRCMGNSQVIHLEIDVGVVCHVSLGRHWETVVVELGPRPRLGKLQRSVGTYMGFRVVCVSAPCGGG